MNLTANSDAYFHIFNRGVEKRTIFQDQQDYGVFLSYLKEYLSSKEESRLQEKLSKPISTIERNKVRKLMRIKNFYKQIDLLAYCLMPNHFHFFLRQNENDTLDNFMRCLCTRYAMYFNAKYERVGPLFQGRYKSVLVDDEGQYLEITRYIHKQALIAQGPSLQEAYPSSFGEYTGIRKTEWVKSEEIVANFSDDDERFSYTNFVIEAMQGPSLQEETGEI